MTVGDQHSMQAAPAPNGFDGAFPCQVIAITRRQLLCTNANASSAEQSNFLSVADGICTFRENVHSEERKGKNSSVIKTMSERYDKSDHASLR